MGKGFNLEKAPFYITKLLLEGDELTAYQVWRDLKQLGIHLTEESVRVTLSAMKSYGELRREHGIRCVDCGTKCARYSITEKGRRKLRESEMQA